MHESVADGCMTSQWQCISQHEMNCRILVEYYISYWIIKKIAKSFWMNGEEMINSLIAILWETVWVEVGSGQSGR